MQQMTEIHIMCECSQPISVLEFNDHSESCQAHQDYLKQEISKTVIPANEVIQVKNTSTYNCPHCDTKNLDRLGLIDHI